MYKLTFQEKRDKDESLLRFKVPALGFDVSKKIFKTLSSYKAYGIVKKRFNNDYLQMYFEKKINDIILPICSQMIINNWNYENKSEEFSKTLYFDDNCFFPYIKKIMEKDNIRVEKKKSFKFKKLNEYYKWLFYINFLKIKKLLGLNLLKKFNDTNQDVKIGVNCVEGNDLKKRNDLFWFHNNKIKSSSIIYYVDSKKKLDLIHQNLDNKFKNIILLKIWEWQNVYNVNFIDEAYRELKVINPADDLEKWLMKEIKLILIKINFWYCFFQDYNIKIHFNSEEYGYSNIIKQIALKKANGCSIGKCRSVPRKISGDWYGFYPNDVFFVWGEDSGDAIIKSNNFFDNILISGYPYPDDEHTKNAELSKIKSKFNEHGVNFIILLVDGAHANNDNFIAQNIPSYRMSEFINSFLNLVMKNENFGLIIKSKKPEILKKLSKIDKRLAEVKKTNRCVVIDTFGSEPKIYSELADISVGISVDFPTALLQIAISGSRSIIYDYSNFKNLDKNLYNWGENKVIFRDLKLMLKNIKNFQEKRENISDLGNWSNQIKLYDSFLDKKGSERIEEYTSHLLSHLKKGNLPSKSLKYANVMYQNKWGKNKILKSTYYE